MRRTYGALFQEGTDMRPYTDNGELTGELYLSLNTLLSMAMETVQKSGGSIMQLPGRQPETTETAAAVAKTRQEMRRIGIHMENRLRLTEANTGLAFAVFSDRLNLCGWQRLALLLGSACDRDPRYGDVFAGLLGDQRRRYATKGLVYALADLAGEDGRDIYEEMLAQQEFFHICFQKMSFVPGEGFLEEPLVLKRRLFYYFHGLRSGTYPEGVLEYYDPAGRRSVCFQERRYQELRRLWQAEPGPDVILMQGREGSGRKFLVRQISEESGRPALFASCSRLRQEKDEQALYDSIYLELIMEDGCLCITDCEKWTKEGEQSGDGQTDVLIGLVKYMKRRRKKVIVTATERLSGGFGPGIRSAEICLEEMDSKTRSEVWHYFLHGAALSVDTAVLGGRYALNAGEIERAVNSAAFCRLQDEREEICEQDVLQALKQYHGDRLSGYAQLLESPVILEDLVVPGETWGLLQALLERMRYRSLAGEEWGFYGKVTYGRGVCALFYGPPGTGKTMAAQALANALGLNLYRVDLSRMMSKYIGETEKNISRLFEKAVNINALLFFDEADAFFSRRTQVNDSHDRNANGEVAHLLQKLEEYDGLSVLASNLKDNMDDAFFRRIQYGIPFPFPDAAQREALWRRMLPVGAPVGEELELGRFARQFEMAGGEIRETLMQAAVQAAAEGCGIKNSHIAKAVRRCMEKYGREVTEEELRYFL